MNIFMRLTMVLLIFILYLTPNVQAQNLIEAKPAELQILGETIEGEGIIVQSSDLIILYRPGGIDVSG